jgi:Zn-dependent alcohol dehydrogenase
VTAGKRTQVGQWHRNVKRGAWIIRYRLPKQIKGGHYKLTVEAKTTTQRRAATIRTQIKHGKIALTGRKRVIVVNDGVSPKMTLGVQSSKLVSSAPANVYHTAFWTRNVSVIVINIDRQGMTLVHNLHIVFPDLKIVAVTKHRQKIVKARRFGASAVVVGTVKSATPVVTNTVRSLLASYNG